MVDVTLELVKTWPVWEMSLSGETERGDEISTGCRATVLSLDGPLLGLVVELGIDDAAVKGYILPDVQLRVDVVKILSQLFPAGILLRPIPVLDSWC